MIKYFLILMNVIGLLFFNTFFIGDPVTISQNFPESVVAGTDYVVEIKISKGDIGGFAELQQTLPDGFNATAIDSKTGAFSFTDHEVKIIWMSLPVEKEFSIKYKLTIAVGNSNQGFLDGQFSYLDNNQKTTVNLEQKKIMIDNSMAKINLNSTSDGSSIATVSSPMSGPVMCTRYVNNQYKPNQIMVEIQIANDSISGFAKLEETIPAGFTAEALDAHNAVFSFVDNKAKFLWMSFPFEKEFRVSYILMPAGASPDAALIDGALSFTLDQQSKKFTIASSQVSMKSNRMLLQVDASGNTVEPTLNAIDTAVLPVTSLSSLSTDPNKTEITSLATGEETTTDSSSKSNEPSPMAVIAIGADVNPIATENNTQENVTPTENASKESTVNENIVSTSSKPKTEKSETTETANASQSSAPLGKVEATKTLTSIPDAPKGISFRVQICAVHKPVEVIYFKENYKINEEVYAEMHEGWHKFTVNNVSTYKLARDKREELRSNEMVKGPFVAAYNSGSRITVQEALMIANQKWMK